jgi:hypothetical protein
MMGGINDDSLRRWFGLPGVFEPMSDQRWPRYRDRYSDYRFRLTSPRAEEAWRFIARRAAWDDASVESGHEIKRRVITAAFYVAVPTNRQFESVTGQSVGGLTARILEEHGFAILTVDVLPPGSYGAIIFAESTKPETLEQTNSRLDAAVRDLLSAIKDQFKAMVAQGLIILAIGGGLYIIGMSLSDGQITCSPDRIEDLKRNVAEARNSDEIARIVKAYCHPENSTVQRIFEAFGIN